MSHHPDPEWLAEARDAEAEYRADARREAEADAQLEREEAEIARGEAWLDRNEPERFAEAGPLLFTEGYAFDDDEPF